jgi:hypothetical protein
LQVDQAKRLKELEQAKSKLNRLVANLSLQKLVLKDIAEGNLSPERRRSAVAHAQQQGFFVQGSSQAGWNTLQLEAGGRHSDPSPLDLR